MNIIVIITVVIGLLLDQISKFIISYFIDLNSSIKLIENFLFFSYKQNYGAAWGLLSGMTPFLIIVSIISIFLIIKYITIFKNNIRNNLAFGFLLAGIFGNLLDRVFFGYVRDFIDVRFGSYNYPIFNLADSMIVIGAGLLVIAILKGEDNNAVKSKRK